MKTEFPKWYPWDSPLKYLAVIYRTADSQKIEHERCSRVLSDLECSITNSLIASSELLNFRNWNLPTLQERGRQTDRPRIWLAVNITDKGNLTLRWYPTDCSLTEFNEEKNETDFSSRIHLLKDHIFPGERPINELMFIHDILELHIYEKKSLSYLKKCLLRAIAASIRHWQTQLSYYCEVKLLTDLEFKIEDQKIIEWSIYNVEERRMENEKKWIAEFENEWGLSPKRFVEFYQKADGWNKFEKMNKALKKSGFKFNLGVVKKAIQRLETYHKEFFDSSITQRNESNP